MMRARLGVALLAFALPLSAQQHAMRTLPPLPDSAGIAAYPLTTRVSPAGDTWIGTYGRGIFVLPGNRNETVWRRIVSDTTATSISMNFVHAIAFAPGGDIWYGTVGNGWGMSRDGGKTWRNWTFTQLGPEWQYVAPDGIVVRGDTVAIATADGIQVTTDRGDHWVALADGTGPLAKGPADTAIAVLPNEYVTALSVHADGWHATHLRGITTLRLDACLKSAAGATHGACVVRTALRPRDSIPVGLVAARAPLNGSARHWTPWFARPIAHEDNDRIDQTYRWGSTMGGFFQPHQGVEFNNPDGTAVHAAGDGRVVYAGRAERGALTVAIEHDRRLQVGDSSRFVFTVYYHNSELLVHVGDRVRRGQLISRVGHTGRATNDHMHLEVHAAPTDSVRFIVDSLNRYPPYTTNTELWITPLPGTGAIAGTVSDARGNPVPQAQVYGIRKPLPRETPFVFAESYGPRNRPHPVYGEQFAVSDVPVGTHRLFVVIDGQRVERTVTVKPGALSWVDFRP